MKTVTQSPTALSNLLSRRDIWRGYDRAVSRRVRPTGHTELDALLLGGWPKTALIELACHHQGIGELSLLLPTLEKHTQAGELCILLDPPYQPHAPSWVSANIALENLVVVRSQWQRDWLWAAELSIRNGALLLAWPNHYKPNYSDLRKLQLAAIDNQQSAFLFNRPENLCSASPSPLRLEIDSHALHQLDIRVHKFSGAIANSRVQIKSSLLEIERTPLNQLNVPICYPEDQSTGIHGRYKNIDQTLNT